MATFYCIHGSPFHGDGTTSAEATVDGGVGAFNEAIACFDGTVLDPTVAVAQVDTITVTTVTDSIAYTVTINGNLYTYTSIVGETVAGIIQGLAAVIAEAGVTAANITDTSITLTADVVGVAFTTSVTAELALTLTTANVSTNLAVSDGDTIIFKTTLADNVSNVETTLTSNLTIQAGSVGLTRNYVMDDGTVWAGAQGMLRVNLNGVRTILQGAYTYIDGDDSELRLEFYVNSDGNSYYNMSVRSSFSGVHLLQLMPSANYDYPAFALRQVSNDTETVLGVFKQTTYGKSYNSTQPFLSYFLDSLRIYIAHHIVDTQNQKSTVGIYSGMTPSNQVSIHIGTLELININNTQEICDRLDTGSSIQIDRLIIDNANYTYPISDNVSTTIGDIIVNGVSGFGFLQKYYRHSTRWIPNKNYPVVNAVLPDKVSKWSMKVELSTTTSDEPEKASDIFKIYTGVNSIRTLSIDVLISDLFVNPNCYQFFGVFTYEDSNNIIRTESTKKFNTPLTAGTAIWDASTYGVADFTSYKFELTTKFPILQGSTIHTHTVIATPVPNVDTFYFINPDIGIS